MAVHEALSGIFLLGCVRVGRSSGQPWRKAVSWASTGPAEACLASWPPLANSRGVALNVAVCEAPFKEDTAIASDQPVKCPPLPLESGWNPAARTALPSPYLFFVGQPRFLNLTFRTI